ncbi:MAG: hypothetical protein ACOYJI_05430 [Anaerovoracaceae bacterium]|jgi:hypothetical protein
MESKQVRGFRLRKQCCFLRSSLLDFYQAVSTVSNSQLQKPNEKLREEYKAELVLPSISEKKRDAASHKNFCHCFK